MESSAPSTMPKLRKQLWIRYAGLRNNTLPPLWNRFLECISCSTHTGKPLLMELMNESIVDYLIKKAFPVLEVPRVTQSVELSKDEENILRYACGYVSMKLRPRFSKLSGDKAAQFFECLDRMTNDNDEGPTTSFLDYTRE